MDSRARLHCCGSHHGDSHTPAGVILSFGPSSSSSSPGHEGEGQGEWYGTGDNEDAAVLLRPSVHYPAGAPHTKLLADAIARGANVTVVLPVESSSSSSSSSSTLTLRDDKTEGGKRKRGSSLPQKSDTTDTETDLTDRWLGHLTRMGVSTIGLLVTDPSALPRKTTEISCIVLLTTERETVFPPGVPCSVITLSDLPARGGREGAAGTEGGDGDVRRTEIETKDGVGLLNDASSQGYNETMREVLYFFKKHMHDWS